MYVLRESLNLVGDFLVGAKSGRNHWLIGFAAIAGVKVLV